VQTGLHRQGDGVPLRMPGQGRQGDEDLSVQELLARGAGGGVVVDASPFDLRPVAWRGRVVEGEQETVVGQQRFDGGQDARGEVRGLATAVADGRVSGAELGGDATGPEPGGDGASPGSEEEAEQQGREGGAEAAVEESGEGRKNTGQQGRQKGE